MYQLLVFVGNLGRDPEMRYTPNGQPVTHLNVASNRMYNSNGQKVKETTWFRVSAWGKTAENCNQFLHKGDRVLVEGRLQPDEHGGPRVWTRQDGTAAASYEVTANMVRFLSNKGENGEEPEEGSFESGDDDVAPF